MGVAEVKTPTPSTPHDQMMWDAGAEAERTKIADAIRAQQYKVDLDVIGVPDGIDPEFARSAAIVYFNLICDTVREQSAAVARAGGPLPVPADDSVPGPNYPPEEL